MKIDTNLNDMLYAVEVAADWVGLREVYEAHTPRMIRDGVPVENGRYSTHGIMVEVLVDGQFGYYGTPDISKEGVARASRKAFDQAKRASEYAIHKFTSEVRPKSVGNYKSPFLKDVRDVTAEELNALLLEAYKHLKVSKDL